MKQNFKEKLISLREEFLNYLRMNGCEGVPTKVQTILKVGIKCHLTKVF